MSRALISQQSDLFADGDTPAAHVPEDFIARIRAELLATIACVESAALLPWSDPAKAMLTEMRFHSISNWLPDQEAAALRARFDSQLERLYAEG